MGFKPMNDFAGMLQISATGAKEDNKENTSIVGIHTQDHRNVCISR